MSSSFGLMKFSGPMGGYTATMSTERQESFEVEIAQVQARLELQEARKARQEEMGVKDYIQSPIQYKVCFLFLESFYLYLNDSERLRISVDTFTIGRTAQPIRTASLEISSKMVEQEARQVYSKTPILKT